MVGKLADELTASSQRLRTLADKVANVRNSVRPPAPGPAAPLFPAGAAGGGPLDDVELNFQVDETERGRTS